MNLEYQDAGKDSKEHINNTVHNRNNFWQI